MSREALAADVRRVAERLRSLSDARLAATVPGHASRADAGRRLAQCLAEAAQGVEERDEPGPPSWRELPVVSDLAVGDQVAVTGQDLLTALTGVPDEAPVWSRHGQVPARDVTAHAAELLVEVRGLL